MKQQEEVNLVAVYGSLRKGMGNHSYLTHCKYVGDFNSEPIYDMYSVSGAYPALVSEGNTSINMEVYQVSKQIQFVLNRLEGYQGIGNPDNLYDRVIIDTPYGKAYLYLFNMSVSRMVQVESGDWVSFKNSVKLEKV